MQLLGSCNLQTTVQHQLSTESRVGAEGDSHSQLSGRQQHNSDM